MEGEAGEECGRAAEFDGVWGGLDGLGEGVGGGGLVLSNRVAGEELVDAAQAWAEFGVGDEGEELEAAEGETGAEGGEVALELDEGAEEFGMGVVGHAVTEVGWSGRGALKVGGKERKGREMELSDARRLRESAG